MTGVDLSPASLAQARRLAAETGTDVDFVESEVYRAAEALGENGFDLVFTGIGALCWLPSVRRWAEVVAALLAPGGRLFIREGHPMLWTLEDGRPDGLLVADYPYFETDEPTVEEVPGTYVETDVIFEHNLTHTWNHGLGEIVTAVLDAGMEIVGLVEHDSVPWDALPGQMQCDDRGEWRLIDRPWRLPHSYTLQAIRRGAPRTATSAAFRRDTATECILGRVDRSRCSWCWRASPVPASKLRSRRPTDSGCRSRSHRSPGRSRPTSWDWRSSTTRFQDGLEPAGSRSTRCWWH